jgi:hypothetical protein
MTDVTPKPIVDLDMLADGKPSIADAACDRHLNRPPGEDSGRTSRCQQDDSRDPRPRYGRAA